MRRYVRTRVICGWVALLWLAGMYHVTLQLDWSNHTEAQTNNNQPVFALQPLNRTPLIVTKHEATPTMAFHVGKIDLPDLKYEVSSRRVDKLWLEFWKYVHSKMRDLAHRKDVDETFRQKIENMISMTSEFVREPLTSSMRLRLDISWEEVRRSRTDAWTNVKVTLHALRNASNSGGAIVSFVNALLANTADMPRLLDDDYKVLSAGAKTSEETRRLGLSRLSQLIQARLRHLQTPKDCSRTRQVICIKSALCGTGFGCQLNHLAACFITAYATNRTVVVVGLPFAGFWSKYLGDIGSSCGRHQTTVDQNVWSRKTMTELDSHDAISLTGLSQIRSTPEFAPLAVPEELSDQILSLHGDPSAWWIGQILKFIVRPNSNALNDFNWFTNFTGLSHPYIGLQVRRTDKVFREAKSHNLEEYLLHAGAWFDAYENNTTGNGEKVVRQILLSTDEPRVVEEANNRYPNYKFIYDMEAATAAMQPGLRLTDGPLYGILKDILLLANSDYIVCTFSSNVCRVAYALMQTRHEDMSARFKSLDDMFYFSGQNPHKVAVISDHARENAKEIDLKVSDDLGMLGNHWNGFSKGVNYKTKQEGFFPTYKVVDLVRRVHMPLYEEVDIARGRQDRNADLPST